MCLFLLVVSNGERKGRFVGRNIIGLRANSKLQETPEIEIPGTDYSLFAQKDAASHFSEWKALMMRHSLRISGIEVTIERLNPSPLSL
jgi:hypothetical protein